MTVTIQIDPEVESRLLAQARARGVSVDAYLQTLMEEFIRDRAGSPMTIEERAGAFEEWAESFPQTPALSDADISRESIYGDD